MKNDFKLNQILNLLQIDFKARAIFASGTNGKGSSARYLAHMLSNTPKTLIDRLLPLAARGNFCPQKSEILSEVFQTQAKSSLDEFIKRFGWRDFLTDYKYFFNDFEEFEYTARENLKAKICKIFDQNGEFHKEIIKEKNLRNQSEICAENLETKLKNPKIFAKTSTNFTKVAHFSSPHIFSVYERFWCNYLDQDKIKIRCDKALNFILNKLQNLNLLHIFEPSFFEYLCLILPLVFYDADIVIIEAGVGARYDSTRVFSCILNLLCEISFDHAEFFKNLADVKFNKILKYPYIASLKNHKELELLKRFNINCEILPDHPQMREISKEFCLDKSEFLQENFALAALAYFQLFKQNYNKKLIKLDLPARSFVYQNCLIDCAHNESAAKALAASITKRHIVLLFKSSKDNQAILNALLPHALSLSALNSFTQNQLEIFAKNHPPASKLIKTFKINFLLENPNNHLICGSFDAVRAGILLLASKLADT